MIFQEIIDKYYGSSDSELKRILVCHSRAVADKALHIADRHPELGLDRQFLEEAAMLHDIGIIRCNAPGICCYGTAPYIQHGLQGAEMLQAENLPRHAHVCSHHTGAGISRGEVVSQRLELPVADYLPETLEEKVICYADKFFSKTRLGQEKTLDEVYHSIAKFGEEGLCRFKEWEKLFE